MMDSLHFNGTLLAQLLNFVILFIIVAVVGRLIYRVLSGSPDKSRFGKLEDDLQEIKTRLGDIEKKLDKRG